MRIAICDDTNTDLSNIKALVEEFNKINYIQCEIDTYSDSFELIRNLSIDYSIYILDVVMPKNGIDTAQEIKKIYPNAIIIFQTTSKEFAIDAFRVKAFDYILKPLEKDQVFKTLNDAYSLIKNKPKNVINIKTTDSLETVEIKSIAYIESINRRINYYLINRKTITSNTIRAKFLDSIPFHINDFNFVLCHNSFIVNMDQIKSITEASFIMKNGSVVPISRRMLKEVRERYTKYLLGDSNG